VDDPLAHPLADMQALDAHDLSSLGCCRASQ
jgi:hypothetical protein